jgi:tetratricopeptide (TPR) repeat protein
LDSEATYCTGTAASPLAEAAFDDGRLAEASRYASTAIRFLQAQPAAQAEILSPFNIEIAVQIERGRLNEDRASIERWRALPAESPAQQAAIRPLAGALHQAQGDSRAAEREYVEAIRMLDGMQANGNSIRVRLNLSVVFSQMKRVDEAIAVLERALSLMEHANGPCRILPSRLTNNLAVSYAQRGDTAKAVESARAPVRLAGVVKVGRYELIANVYANSASIVRAAGSRKEAADLDTRANRAHSLANALVDVSVLPRPQSQP